MRIYDNKKTGLTTIVGVVESISDDRLKYNVKSETFNRTTNKRENISLPVSNETPLDEKVSVGDKITVVGFNNPRNKSYDAMFVTTESGSFDYEDLSVISGEVMFASYNEEKNADGSARMTKERTAADGSTVPAKPKKPHFDIAVSTVEPDPDSDKEGATRRVLHIVSVYSFPGKTDEDKAKDPIIRVKKLFGNYSHKENPAYVTIVTTPGMEYTTEKTVGDKTYVNHNVRHMGYKALDVEFAKIKDKDKAESKGTEEKAEKAEDPAPAPAKEENAGSGFEAPTVNEEDVSVDNLFID